MIVGYHAPLPPSPTGVADYAADLLVELRKRGRVEVNPRQASIRLYHLGNNQLHREIHDLALREPGVVLLHDAVLHHFYLGSLTREGYLEEFCYNYGVGHRGLAEALWEARARSGVDPLYFHYPMLRRVAQSARSVVVHNPAAAVMVRQHCATAVVAEVPHLFREPNADAFPSAEFRAGLGVADDDMLIGVLGHLRESKRVATVAQVVLAMAEHGSRVRLLLAGECASADLERTLEPFVATNVVIRRGYLPDPEFWTCLDALDVVVNLRYPGAGETSGIAIRAMGMGKPVILSDGLETAPFPTAACLRIDTQCAEREMLENYLGFLHSYPEARRQIGVQAQQYIRRQHNCHRVGKQLWDILVSARPGNG